MALAPEEEAKRIALDIARGQSFLTFVRDKYHSEVFPLIENFLAFSIDSGGITDSAPSYRIFDVVSNEIRNAMDHLGRSCGGTQKQELDGHIRMAEWHLDLAQIRILIPIIQDTRDLMRDALEYARSEKLPSLDAAQLEKMNQTTDSYLSSMRDVDAWVRPPAMTRMILTPPSDDEMEATQTIAANLRIVSKQYGLLASSLWGSPRLPKIGPLRQKLHLVLRKKRRIRIYEVLLGGLVVTGLAGAYGNFSYAAIKKLIEYLCSCTLPSGW